MEISPQLFLQEQPTPSYHGTTGFPKCVVVTPKKSNLELIIENFAVTQTCLNEEFENQNLHTNEVLRKLTTRVESAATNNKMLDTQISQVVKQQLYCLSLPYSFQDILNKFPRDI